MVFVSMTLNAWLSANKIGTTEFAKMIGITREQTSNLRHGRYWPRKKTALAIYNATDGKVHSWDVREIRHGMVRGKD